MDAFAWTVIGSAAGLAGVAVAIVFGIIPLVRQRHKAAAPTDLTLLVAVTGGHGASISAAPAAPTAANTLPADVPRFIGRGAELEQVIQIVSGAVIRIDAIDGMAGVGKTAFAVHAAHELARQELYRPFRSNHEKVLAALLNGISAGHQASRPLYWPCRGVQPSSVSFVGFLWGSLPDRGSVGILLGSGQDADDLAATVLTHAATSAALALDDAP